MIKATVDKEDAQEKVNQAYARIPEQYHSFVVLLKQNVRLGEPRSFTPTAESQSLGIWQSKNGVLYVPIELPYMTVDGRVQWARDEHRKENKALNIRTEICNEYVRAEIESEMFGQATATAKIGSDSGVDKTNPIENAETGSG